MRLRFVCSTTPVRRQKGRIWQKVKLNCSRAGRSTGSLGAGRPFKLAPNYSKRTRPLYSDVDHSLHIGHHPFLCRAPDPGGRSVILVDCDVVPGASLW